MSFTQEKIHKLLWKQFIIIKNASRAARNINELIGQNVVPYRTARYWFKKFREGHTKLGRKHGQGRRVSVNRHVLAQRFKQHPDISATKLAEGVCSKMTASRWLRSRGLNWRKAHELLHILTEQQKQKRVDMCKQLQKIFWKNGFLRNVTCDESWVYFENPHRGKQWISPKHKGVPVPRRSIHGKKLMLCFLEYAWPGELGTSQTKYEYYL